MSGVRRKGGNGKWLELDTVTEQPARFQRIDGSVMTEEEITKVATTTGNDFKKTPAKPARARREPTAKQAQAWEAAKRTGSVGAVAKELGVSYKAITDRIDAYMARSGLPESTRPYQKRGSPMASGVVKERVDHAETIPLAAQIADDDSDEPIAPPAPVIAVVHMGDSEAHARSFNEGYETALQEFATDRAVEALFDWLTVHGSSWTQAQAERWFGALTSVIDLVYPTTEAPV